MGLPKGKTNNKAGRPVGSANKNAKELRNYVSQFIESNLHTLQNDFDKLDSPKDRLQFMEKLFQYSLPKLQATSIEVDSPIELKNLPPWMTISEIN